MVAPEKVVIEAAELRRVDLELAEPVETAAGAHRSRPIVLVRLATDQGEAVGECSALAEPTYTSEYADAAAAVLERHLLPRLLDGGPFTGLGPTEEPAGLPLADEGLRRLAAVRGHHMAKAAVEMALADLECRLAGRPLADSIGAERRSVPAGATIGLATPMETVAAARLAAEAGYRRLKLKVQPGSVPAVEAVRSELPEIDLALDANGSYRLGRDDAELARLDELGLVAIEQPLPADDLVAHAELQGRSRTRIVLDESVATEGQLDAALALQAGLAISIKPARCGGLLAAVAAVERCKAAGADCLVGGLFESGLGRAASIAVAALDGVRLPGELGASDRYFADDLTEPHALRADGTLAVPTGPGLGVHLLAADTGRLLTQVRPEQGRRWA